MEPTELRRQVVLALFSDDELVNELVVKGGNALELLHGVVSRGSLDIDISIQEDFRDIASARDKLFRAVETHFRRIGYVAFDLKLAKKPRMTTEPDPTPWWGGYELTFKLIEETRYEDLAKEPQAIQREAITTDARQRRTFRIDISKYEYCEGKEKMELDGRSIYVYSPEMCAIEKLRAICQQMPEYPHVANKRPRARDFYDIHAVISKLAVDLGLPENLSLTKSIFDAKRVPLTLLAKVNETHDYHVREWESVRTSILGSPNDFRFYFDFVVAEINNLESLWNP